MGWQSVIAPFKTGLYQAAQSRTSRPVVQLLARIIRHGEFCMRSTDEVASRSVDDAVPAGIQRIFSGTEWGHRTERVPNFSDAVSPDRGGAAGAGVGSRTRGRWVDRRGSQPILSCLRLTQIQRKWPGRAVGQRPPPGIRGRATVLIASYGYAPSGAHIAGAEALTEPSFSCAQTVISGLIKGEGSCLENPTRR